MQLITSKQEPNAVGIHPMMIALVLSRKNVVVTEKVKRIFLLVCFQVSPGRIQWTEALYVFHLVYNWIRVTTYLDLQTSSVQKSTFKRVVDENKETVPFEETYVWISKQEELEPLFAIFTKESRAQQPGFKANQVVQHLRQNLREASLHAS